MRFTWLAVMGLVLFAGVGCNELLNKVFEDPRYIAAKEQADAAKAEAEAAVAGLAAAKTAEEKAAAGLVLTAAEEKFASAVTHLEKVKDEAINSPASGFLGMLTSVPGIIGTIASGILALLGGAVQVSRKNYKAALGEVAVGLEQLSDSPEGKALKKKIGLKLEGTGVGKVLDTVLGEKGLLRKSRLT